MPPHRAVNIDYMKRQIIQASDLKAKIESLGVTNNNSTVVSIDAEAYYPSVRLKLVRKAVKYFSASLDEESQKRIDDCLDMIKFSMCSTVLTFRDKYYEYDGDMDPEEKGLTIGGYESAWLADLVGAYILENTQQHFTETSYHGLYRDDGFAIFKGKWSYTMMSEWHHKNHLGFFKRKPMFRGRRRMYRIQNYVSSCRRKLDFVSP